MEDGASSGVRYLELPIGCRSSTTARVREVAKDHGMLGDEPEPLNEIERQRLRYIVERLDEALTLAETVPGDLSYLLALAQKAAAEALGEDPAK